MTEAFDRAGALARQALHSEISDALHREGRERIVATAVGQRFARRRTRSVRTLLLVAAAAAVIAFGVMNLRRPLGYRVEGAAQFDSSYVGAALDKPAKVRFDDGSLVEADPGSRLRIDDSYAGGARVLLERGVATAHVAHAGQSRWRFIAGPFAVHVTGTKFRLRWEPETEEVDLELYEGSVEVESPLSEGRLAVRAGQRFRASLPKGSLQVEAVATAPRSAIEPPPAANSAPAAAARAEIAAEPAASAAVKPAVSDAQEPRRVPWPELVRQGEFAAVVEAARARGVETSLATASAEELRALADAARYAGEAALAERALLSIRRRFARSAGSAAAAFLLGRTEEGAGDLSGADRWYGMYLAEAPGGELAADALAGRMRVAGALRGEEAARELALEYLRRYPRGVHALRAKKIAGRE